MSVTEVDVGIFALTHPLSPTQFQDVCVQIVLESADIPISHQKYSREEEHAQQQQTINHTTMTMNAIMLLCLLIIMKRMPIFYGHLKLLDNK